MQQEERVCDPVSSALHMYRYVVLFSSWVSCFFYLKMKIAVDTCMFLSSIVL